MDIFWRKEGRKEKGNGRKKRRGNSDNARFHISPEKMNEPSLSLASSAAAGAATGNTSQDGFSVGLIVELN